MRHDWNSLLSDPSHAAQHYEWPASSTDPGLTLVSAESAGWLFFRNYSKSYYPHADDLVKYLKDWAEGQGASSGNLDGAGHPGNPLHIRYNSTVLRVESLQSHDNADQQVALPPRFRLFLSSGAEMTCTFLILATGLSEPVMHAGINVEQALSQGWLQQYHNVSTGVYVLS
jgi:hypothetical protein